MIPLRVALHPGGADLKGFERGSLSGAPGSAMFQKQSCSAGA